MIKESNTMSFMKLKNRTQTDSERDHGGDRFFFFFFSDFALTLGK